jgi:hypothetical protein
MERVFLGGTTAGTTWRVGLIDRLQARGVRTEQIFNPHLPKGVPYTLEFMEEETRVKNDPNTIVLMHICPANKNPDTNELLGPISMYEIGRYGWTQPHRTAIVLGHELFTKSRSKKVLQGIAAEFSNVFGTDNPPYFSSLPAAENWIVSQLVE